MKTSKNYEFSHDEKIRPFDNHSIYYIDYIKVKHIKENKHGEFEFTVSEDICERVPKGGNIDYGVLLTMIDGVSSYAQIFIAEKYKQISLSVNLNIKIFKQLKKGKTYELYVKMYNEDSKIVVIKCQIYSKSGQLMCLATHIKRNIIPKF
jgi:hypothetical protein